MANSFIHFGGEKRSISPANKFPSLKDAITSIEDKRFYSHMGLTNPYRRIIPNEMQKPVKLLKVVVLLLSN